jgi:hypothetical protein
MLIILPHISVGIIRKVRRIAEALSTFLQKTEQAISNT